VENPLISSGSHPPVCLGLDHDFDVNVNINTGVDHLSFPVPPPLRSSYPRSPLLPACGPDILPAAILASSSAYSYSAPAVEEAQRRDEGHGTNSRLRYAWSETDGRTDGRNTGGRAGKEETNQVQVQAGTIHLFHPLFYITFHVNQTSYLTLPLIGLLFRHRHLHRHTFPRASIQLLPSPPSSATSTLVYVYSVISSAVLAVFGQLSREEFVSGGELGHEGLACTHLCTTPDHNHLTFSSTLPKSISKALHPLIFFH
jgi:hypothetical protein